MEKMKLTQYIINEYLVPSGHYFGDKIIFVNCSNEFLELAKDVAQKENKVKACFVKIDEKTINLFTEIQALFHVDIQKTVMTRTLLSLLVIREVMKKFQLKEFGGYDTITLDEVNDGIKSFHEKNIEKMKVCYFNALLPTDLDCITDKFGKGSFELNFVLPDGNDNLIIKKKELEKVNFQTFEIPVIKNYNGEKYTAEDNMVEILANHVVNPVKFGKSIETMLEMGVDTFIEIGPGKTLSGFVKKVCKKLEKEVNVFNIENVETLESTLETIEK